MFPMVAATLHSDLGLAADRFGGRDAVLAGDDRWTFRQLDERSNAFAGHLGARGVRPGDRVALMTTNRVEFIAAVYAISTVSTPR